MFETLNNLSRDHCRELLTVNIENILGHKFVQWFWSQAGDNKFQQSFSRYLAQHLTS